MTDASKLLQEISGGNDRAGEELFPLVYRELRDLAARQLRNESAAHTLQPTALVHEAYLRLIPSQSPKEPNGSLDNADQANELCRIQFEDQAHFFAAAAQAMRRILIDHARHKKRLKRGAEWQRVPIDLNQLKEEADRLDDPDYLLSLNESLDQLKETDPTAAELVHLRYFAGLTVDQAAVAMGISPRTASRTWNFARVWLFERISGKDS